MEVGHVTVVTMLHAGVERVVHGAVVLGVRGMEMHYVSAFEVDDVVLVVVYAVQNGLCQLDRGEGVQQRVDSAGAKNGMENLPRNGRAGCLQRLPQRICQRVQVERLILIPLTLLAL